MSLAGPLTDCFARVHTDLRISVTDRCNLRCYYCMPTDGVQFRPHAEILTYEEIERFVRVAAKLGIRKVRITGGEPLVRKDLPRLVQKLADVPGIDELALTTNGVLLDRYAGNLKAAGLHRLNVSLDSVDPERFSRIARRDELPRVLAGIAAAGRAGFENIRLNALAIRGVSEEEIVPLARFAREHGLELRFIEFMPADGDRRWDSDRVLPGEEILETLSQAYGPLEPISPNGSRAPASEYRFLDGVGRIGLIRSVTRPFCGHCTRLRLTADGMVRNCLFSGRQWDAKAVLRSGGTPRQLAQLLQIAVSAKTQAHGTADGDLAAADRPMHQIGG